MKEEKKVIHEVKLDRSIIKLLWVFVCISDWEVMRGYVKMVPKAGLEPARAKLTTPSR